MPNNLLSVIFPHYFCATISLYVASVKVLHSVCSPTLVLKTLVLKSCKSIWYHYASLFFPLMSIATSASFRYLPSSITKKKKA